MILTEICAYLKNYFEPCEKRKDRSFIHSGTFEIKDNQLLNADFLKENQYFRVVNSALNDGVYCNCTEDLKILQNEKFSGAIWEMNIPPAFLKLCEDIQKWSTKNESVDSLNMSPFFSENFGGYSYSKSAGRTGNTGGNNIIWQKQFSDRLKIWRKI